VFTQLALSTGGSVCGENSAISRCSVSEERGLWREFGNYIFCISDLVAEKWER
jgi:hypothetical protein